MNSTDISNSISNKLRILIEKNLSEEINSDLTNSIISVSKELIKIYYSNNKINYSNITYNSINNKIDDINMIDDIKINNKCSYEIGNQSEEIIYNFLLKDFPNMFIEKKSNISHCCDIHIIDEKNKILYMLELKYKQNINREDITKFESDISIYKTEYKIIGLFISLNSKCIPFKINSDSSVYIEDNKIYMINYNKILLELIFKTWYLFINENINNKESEKLLREKKDILKQYIYSDYYNSILRNKENIKIIDELLNNINQYKIYLESIKNNISISIDKYNINKDEIMECINLNRNFASTIIYDKIQELVKSIKYIPTNKLTKKYLVSLYPDLENYIKSKTMKELIEGNI